MSTDPGSGSGADDPRTRVFVSGGEKRFRYDRKDDSKSEPLVVAGTGEVTAGPTTFNDGRFSGRVWRFVTSVDDEACKLLNLVNVCATNKNYKRVTVVVEMSGLHNNLKPIWVSSIVSNPEDGPVGSASGPVTECLNSNGDLVQCVNSVEDKVNALFPTDTPATSSNTRQPITASHATHPTVATVTGLECTASTTTGCPKPDLLEDVPPQVTTPLPQLFKYSTDVAGGYPGGRALRRDASCSSTPTTSDNTKGAFWATPALSAPKTLNGKGGLSLYSQTIDGLTAGATVCVAFRRAGQHREPDRGAADGARPDLVQPRTLARLADPRGVPFHLPGFRRDGPAGSPHRDPRVGLLGLRCGPRGDLRPRLVPDDGRAQRTREES